MPQETTAKQQRARPADDVTDGNDVNRRAGPIAWLLIVVVRGYQATLAPLMSGYCRFQPTCSNYAIQALRSHGALRGGWLAVRRILRCHPLGGIGYDPVPPANGQSSAAESNDWDRDVRAGRDHESTERRRSA